MAATKYFFMLSMALSVLLARSTSSRMFRKLGPDTGFDFIGEAGGLANLAELFDRLEREDLLPKTIVYSLNPSDFAALGSIIGFGCFILPPDFLEKSGPMGVFLGLLIGALAMLLVGMCFIAVGIFVSTLTESTVTASIGTMAILLVFVAAAIFNNLIDAYVVRAVLSWISVYARYVNFTYGIFDIAAVVYYASITAVFLFLAVRVYERRRYA